MKKAMKKLFSLMLVAVLLVGVLPFQAFAAEGEDAPAKLETSVTVLIDDATTGKTMVESRDEGWSASTMDILTKWFKLDMVNDYTFVRVDTEAGSPVEDPSFQIKAGDVAYIRIYTVDPCADGHSAGAAATCTTAQTCTVCGDTLVGVLGHNVVDGDCTRCDYTENTDPTPCPTKDCALNEGHSGEHKCGCGKYLQKGSSHEQDCPYYEAPANTYTLTVWANLYTGKTRTNTIKLDIINGLAANERIYNIISNNNARLRAKFPSNYEYSWSNNVYHKKDAKTSIDMNSHMTVEDIREVYINLYTDEKLVVARVHTSKSYEIARSVEIRGFKIDETVTSSDVLKAVKKSFNVSNMKMYTPSQWSRVVSGKSATTISNHVVIDGDNIIDVYITGSSISSSSSSSKADTTNPKTGDEIYMSVAVLGLSASALAVMFYLNKKRAY